MLGPALSVSEVHGLQVVTDECGKAAWPVSWVAYALATAFHETAGTMQPIKEYGSDEYLRRKYDVTGMNPERARAMGNVNPGDGIRYAGKGLVQLTWHVNYARAEKELGLPFVAQPLLALNDMNAASIMVLGMQHGWFTGRRLDQCLTIPGNAVGTMGAFTRARSIINGSDKAEDIAAYAVQFQTALMRGGWA